MSNHNDKWGHDPSVKEMREVFSKMEEIQYLLLTQIGLSFFDNRLRGVRESARKLFERTVVRSQSNGLSLDEKGMIGIYKNALIQALCEADIPVPSEIIGDHKKGRR